MAQGSTVVGVDGSQSAVAAVRWAAADAAAHGSELVLVASAFPPVTTPFPEGFYIDLRGQAEHALAAATEQARAVASTAEWTVTTQIASESPVAALLEASAGARMLVVGSRGAGAVARWVLGSVSTALAAHTTIPLTVVPSGWSTGETEPADTTGTAGDGRRDAVVVGVDGTAASGPAVAAAFDQAASRGAELVAVHAWADGDFALVHASESLPPSQWATRRSDAEHDVHRALAAARQRYPQVPVRIAVARDRPAHTLLEHAATAQLIVVGSHGRGGFTGMLLGSTSRKVLHLVTCPTLIVPNKPTS